MSAVAERKPETRALLEPVAPPAARSRLWPLAAFAVFVVAAAYHWLQSRGHATPAIFTDELLFAELSRSFAAGDGFSVRDQPFFFPAFVPALLQAPVWLIDSIPQAYGVAKLLNTVLMASAALPAYWLARHLVRPAYALVVSVATVAGGAMVYHGYLTSEAAAYPVFLLTLAVCVRALADPSPRRDLLAVAVLGLAVLTRAQFVVLPLAFVLATLLAGRPLRRHATSMALLVGGGVAVLVAGVSALGFYAGVKEIDYPLGETLRWSGWTAALLPFAAGMLVVPGALLGLGLGVLRPRNRAERAFSTLTASLVVLMPLQAGLIASGAAHRPFERYAFYLVPLAFLAFLCLAERGEAGTRLTVGAGLAIAGLALAVPFSTLALDPYSIDSPTLSAVEAVGRLLTPGDAAVFFAVGGVVAVALAVVLRRRPLVVAGLSIALTFALGIAAYSGDRRMTSRTLDQLAAGTPDWLDRSGVTADVLVLEGGSLHTGWILESWNRNAGRTYHLGDLPTDPLPHTTLGFEPDGTLAPVGGPAVRGGHVVVDESGSQLDLDAQLVTRPRPGLALYRLDRPLRARSVTFGLHHDGWARSVVRYAAFPRRAGEYRVTIVLPAGRLQRRVELESGAVRRIIQLRPGTTRTLRIPASGELAMRADRADFIGAETPRPRLVGFRVVDLEFIAEKGSRKR